MSLCHDFIGHIGGMIYSFISWLVLPLSSSSLGREKPLPELPIATSNSQPTMALLEAFRAAEHNLQARPYSRKDAGRKESTRTEYHSLSFPTPFVYSAHITAESPTPFPTMSTCSPTTDSDVEDAKAQERARLSQEIDAKIGDLGKRRGFKGAPLLFSSTSTSRSSFFSLPKNLSPWSASSPAFLDKPSTPRTPLEAVTNRMRSASTKLARIIDKDISPVLQGLSGQADPFATSGEPYFSPDVPVGLITSANLCSFEPYCRKSRPHRLTISTKQKSSFEDPRDISLKKPLMKTTIYAMSTSDVAPARVSVVRSLLVPRSQSVIIPTSPKIVLTVPSAPSSPVSTSPSAMSVYEDYYEDELRVDAADLPEAKMNEDEGSYFIQDPRSQPFAPSRPSSADVYTETSKESLPTQKRTALGDVGNMLPGPAAVFVDSNLQNEHDSKDLFSVVDISPANLYDFGHYYEPGKFTVPIASKRSSLRPLVLPTRVANRASLPATRLSSLNPMVSTMEQEAESPSDRRSRELDDIIALLDKYTSRNCDRADGEELWEEIIIEPCASYVV
ncbi:hypothetical protein FPV67DRAFT_1482035 [Lyophyllum atratum]|nr:hypothetical protein FPV67DRAFT_1482035 [Lyophyllum atratum]